MQPARRWPKKSWDAAGGLRSTSADMAKFLMANLGLSASSSLVQAMQFAQKPEKPATKFFRMGLGWQVFNDGLINKNGGSNGFGVGMAFYPPKKIGVVLLTNRAGSRPIEVANQIVRKLAQLPAPNATVDPQVGELP